MRKVNPGEAMPLVAEMAAFERKDFELRRRARGLESQLDAIRKDIEYNRNEFSKIVALLNHSLEIGDVLQVECRSRYSDLRVSETIVVDGFIANNDADPVIVRGRTLSRGEVFGFKIGAKGWTYKFIPPDEKELPETE